MNAPINHVQVMDAQDAIASAGHLITCIFMAAADLPVEQVSPIQAVVEAAQQKLHEAEELLQAYREGVKGGAA